MSLNPQNRISLILCVGLLVFQVLGIIYGRFTPARYFCWAPYDTQDRYTVSINFEGRDLTEEEVTNRYRFHSNAWQQQSIHNLLFAIEQYESSYGKEDNAVVTVKYSKNGRPQDTWTYPR